MQIAHEISRLSVGHETYRRCKLYNMNIYIIISIITLIADVKDESNLRDSFSCYLKVFWGLNLYVGNTPLLDTINVFS